MQNLLISLFTVLATLYLFGSGMLFLNSQDIRARRFLAIIVLYMGGFFTTAVVLYYDGYFDRLGFFSPQLTINGVLKAFVIMAYPIEVICSGWLNIKRYLLLSIPMLLVGFLYALDLFVFKSNDVIVTSFSDISANIFALNVFVRVLGLLVTAFYYIYPLLIVEKNIKAYQRKVESNFSDTTKYDIRWLRLLILSLIAISFIRVVWTVKGSVVIGVIYTALLAILSAITIYRGLFQESARLGLKIRENAMSISLAEIDGDDILQDDDIIPNETLQNYAQQIKEWIDNEKPYLRPDLQMMDIAEVFSVNRTYLSRIFNEYIGSSFSQYIKMKRIEYAKHLLVKHPSATINEVALRSGFHSSSTMHKAFTAIVGMTATQYRSQVIE